MTVQGWPLVHLMKRPIIHYLCLAALFLVAATYQARNSWDGVRLLLHPTQIARSPFDLKTAISIIGSVQDEAAKAGVRKGDVLLSVNGRPYRGLAVLAQAGAESRPGDVLTVTVRSQGTGSTAEGKTVGIHLVQLTPPFSRVGTWLVVVKLSLGTPIFCLLLGFWVAAVRPRDPLAWLLLALLLSFTQNVEAGIVGWGRWIRGVTEVYHVGPGPFGCSSSDSTFRRGTMTLARGDVLMAFADGISEAMSPADEEWGEDRLIESVKVCEGLSAADMIARIMSAADAFAAGAKQHDDMTLVILRVISEPHRPQPDGSDSPAGGPAITS